MNCNHGFHETLGEDLSPIRNGKPAWVCPLCGRNKSHEKFLEACKGLGIDPAEYHVVVLEVLESL